jgi:hypothetical protein
MVGIPFRRTQNLKSCPPSVGRVLLKDGSAKAETFRIKLQQLNVMLRAFDDPAYQIGERIEAERPLSATSRQRTVARRDWRCRGR